MDTCSHFTLLYNIVKQLYPNKKRERKRTKEVGPIQTVQSTCSVSERSFLGFYSTEMEHNKLNHNLKLPCQKAQNLTSTHSFILFIQQGTQIQQGSQKALCYRLWSKCSARWKENGGYILPFFSSQLLCCAVLTCSVVSDSLRPYGLQPTRLLCPWGVPGKNAGMGCHFLLQGIFPTQELNPCLLCLLHFKWILYSLSHQGSPPNSYSSYIYLDFNCLLKYFHGKQLPRGHVFMLFSPLLPPCGISNDPGCTW